MKYIILSGIIWGMLSLIGCKETSLQQEVTPTVSFADTVIQVFENAGTETLKVTLSSPAAADTYIQVRIKSETNVKEGTDYVLGSHSLHFAQGATAAELLIDLTDDRVANQNREFTLELIPGKGITKDEKQGYCRVVLLDDESTAAVMFNQTQSVFLESDDTYYLPLTLEGTPSGVVKVTIETIDSTAKEGEHYKIENKEFIVDENFQGIPVTLIDNEEVNEDRMFFVRITSTVGAMQITSKSICTVIIRNDDLGIYFGKAKIEVEERCSKVKIPVKLTKPSNIQQNFVLSCGGTATENTDYALIKEWYIEPGVDSMDIEIEIKQTMGISPDRVLQLGFASTSQNLKVSAKQPNCQINILDCDTKVLFKHPIVADFNNTQAIEIPFVLEQALEHDVTFDINLSALEKLANDDVSLNQTSVTIPKGTTTGSVSVTINQILGRDYIYAELSISKASGATPSAENCRVTKCFPYQTTDLAIASYKTQEDGGGEPAPSGYAAAAIDGNESSYWHSNWSGTGNSFPDGIVVALPDNFYIASTDILRRVASSNSDDKTAEIYISSDISTFDNNGWGTSIGTLQWEPCKTNNKAEHLRNTVLDHPSPAKYMKINFTASHRGTNVQIAEVIVYGFVPTAQQ